MDFSKIPFLKNIDLSNPEKKKEFLKFAGMGAFAVVLIIILLVLPSNDDKKDVEETPSAKVLALPEGEDRDNLEGRTVTDVRSSARRGGQGADELYSAGVVNDDPMGELQGKEKGGVTEGTSDGLPGLDFMTGAKNVYPEKEHKEKPAAQPAKEAAAQPGMSEEEQRAAVERSREARRRRILIERGIDPDTGLPFGYEGPEVAQQTSATDASGKETRKETEDESEDESEKETPKVLVRKSGGISSLGGIGTGSGAVVSSLDSQDPYVDDDPAHPFKVKFAYDEKVASGQRVTLRLCEDMTVDGVLIPANTHLFAICQVGERLTLKVNSIDINGKIYTLNYEAYDNDGGQGLYCPMTTGKRSKREVEQEAQNLGTSALSMALNSYASSIVNAGANIVRSSRGEQKVAVTAGYTFYLMKADLK